MGYFRSPLIVMLNMVKIMMAVLVRCFYDVCKYKASLGTAKRSSRINGTGALLCPSLTALVAAWIASSRSSEALRLTFFLPGAFFYFLFFIFFNFFIFIYFFFFLYNKFMQYAKGTTVAVS